MKKENENEKKNILEEINKKYSNDNRFTPGIFGEDHSTTQVYHNYSIFKDALSSFNAKEKFNEIEKKLTKKNNYDKYIIIEELKDLANEYNDIVKESKENFDFYFKAIFNLYSDYQYNISENGAEIVYDKMTSGIITLLNKNYINYEKKLINIDDRLKALNLKLK